MRNVKRYRRVNHGSLRVRVCYRISLRVLIMNQHIQHRTCRVGLLAVCLFAIVAGTGCNATKRGLCCLDNVCRNRCNCADVITATHPTPAEYVVETANAEMKQLASPPDDELQKKIQELSDKLKETQHERQLAVKEAATANEQFTKLDTEIQQLKSERQQLFSRTQLLTEQLVSSQQHLMRVERGFADVQTEHERTVMKLENRLTQLLDRCSSSTLK